ncbi:MAG: hypothetical protein CMJ83_03325 [Planctomycetes bacterium]|nr:hypothetical protein [Planctomycetota bacterium]
MRHLPLCALIVVLATGGLAQTPRHPAPKVAWKTPISSPSFGGAAVADIDGDGRLEIAFGTYFGDDSVRVLNGEDGTEYWRYDAGNACLDASLRFCDLDGDGKLELVVPVSNQGHVIAFDARSGDERWRYSTQPVECTDTPPTIQDVDGDGKLDVVYGTFKGRLHVINREGKRQRRIDVVKHFIQTGPAIFDLNGDDVNDFVCATFKGDNKVWAIDGKSGKKAWTFHVPGKHIGMYHGCSVGDLDGDGVSELVIAAYDGKVYCLRARDGHELWSAAPGDRYIMAPTVIADLDGDGKSEVIAASENVTVLNGDGSLRWSHRCASGTGWDSATRGASVADLDGDGALDVAVLSGAGLFKVFSGKDGKLLYEFDASRLGAHTAASSSHGVTIADLTGDGKLDVFFVVGATRPQKHGLAVCLTGFKGKGSGWYMLRHDRKNTGNLATPIDPVLLRHIENLKPAAQSVGKPPRPPKTQAPAVARNRASGRPAAAPKQPTSQLRDLAKARGIPAATLEAAMAANVIHPTPQRLAALKKHDHAFRAACLLIETGRSHTGSIEVLRATYHAGDEKLLRELADGPDLPRWGKWTILKGLGLADTKENRLYLLERLQDERDAGHFMSVAEALAMLKDSRATDTVGKQILKFEERWGGVERYLLTSLDRIADARAVPSYIRYLKDPRGKAVMQVLRQLAGHDRNQARRQAEILLGSGRDFPSRTRDALRRFVGQR